MVSIYGDCLVLILLAWLILQKIPPFPATHTHFFISMGTQEYYSAYIILKELKTVISN